MKFAIEQRFRRSAHDVYEAYLDPALYDTFTGLPRLGEVKGLSCTDDGADVVVEAWYRFTADLPPGAGRIVDRQRLTWVEESRYRRSDLSGSFEIRPDHYRQLLRCAGTISLEDAAPGAGTVRRVEGDLRLSLPLWARPMTGRAEGAVVDGLRVFLGAEVPVAEAFIDQKRRGARARRPPLWAPP
ncbi:MAG: hypothetical protein GEV08_24800 [Acidimicrobiia bacterium]|nr:hypothetical protein [Acidimicrobiia bacterium]